MKYLLSALSLILISFSSNAQQAEKWKIVFNKKTVVQTSQEDTVKNVVRVTKKELDNGGIGKVLFEEDPNGIKGWKRSIALYDLTGNPVMQVDSATQMFFYNRDLMKILWTRKKVYVYTWNAPTDIRMAAAIRIRRLHLCTFELLEDPIQ